MTRTLNVGLLFVAMAGGATALAFAEVTHFVNRSIEPYLDADSSEAKRLANEAMLAELKSRVDVTIDPEIARHASKPLPYFHVMERTRGRLRVENRCGDLTSYEYMDVTELALERREDGSIGGKLTQRHVNGCGTMMPWQWRAKPRELSARVVLSNDWVDAGEELVCVVHYQQGTEAEPREIPVAYSVR